MTGNVASSDDRYYPIRVVCRIFSVDRRTVLKWIDYDLLPGATLMGACGWRIPARDVEALKEKFPHRRISQHTAS